MKSHLFVVLMGFLLAGCLKDEKDSKLEVASECWSVKEFKENTPATPMLIDSCTGNTYLLLQDSYPKQRDELTPSFTWKWFPVERYTPENVVAGRKK